MENDSFIDSYKQQILDYINSSGDSQSYNLGSYIIRGGALIDGTTGNDTFEFGKILAPNAANDLISAAFDLTGQRMLSAMAALGVYGFMKTEGDIIVEGYSGNDNITIRPMPNSIKEFFGGGAHTYHVRLGPGDDIITGIGSTAAPFTADVAGNDGFDYILEDLSTPGWTLTRPYSNASLVRNTMEGTEWTIYDSVEAIGSGNLWYLTKDMAQNKFIPLTWSEVLEGGKRETAVSDKRNRKKNKRKSKKRFS